MSVFSGVEDSLVLVLICSSILLASFVEGADVMLCAVDSVSFFASPLALCVSLIRSLRNLMDASSAILCAPRRSLGTTRSLMHLVRKVRWLV